jgi:hypothetical protein
VRSDRLGGDFRIICGECAVEKRIVCVVLCTFISSNEYQQQGSIKVVA